MGSTSTEPPEHMQKIEGYIWFRMVTLFPDAGAPLSRQVLCRDAGSY